MLLRLQRLALDYKGGFCDHSVRHTSRLQSTVVASGVV